MFNDIVAAERPATLDSSYGLTFADLYTVEGAARIDQLFCAELAAADAALGERYAQARRLPEAQSAKDEAALLIDVAPHVEDFLAHLFGITDHVRALEARHHELAPLYAIKRQFVQRKAMNAYKADVAATFDGAGLRDAMTISLAPPTACMRSSLPSPMQ